MEERGGHGLLIDAKQEGDRGLILAVMGEIAGEDFSLTLRLVDSVEKKVTWLSVLPHGSHMAVSGKKKRGKEGAAVSRAGLLGLSGSHARGREMGWPR